MNTSETKIQQVEVSIEQARESIAMKDALLRLANDSKDFKLVIDNNYFVNEASRVVIAKANPGLQDPEHQEALDRSITAIGELRQYFQKVLNEGNMAEKALADAQEARVELLQDEA